MNNSVLCHWLLPKVITSTQNTALINGWMNKVKLLEAHSTLGLGSQIAHISTRVIHKALYGCFPDKHTPKGYGSQGIAGVLVVEKGIGPVYIIRNCQL